MNRTHILVGAGIVSAGIGALVFAGSLTPPPGPIAPTMVTLNDLHTALTGTSQPGGSAYLLVNGVVGDVTAPGLMGAIRVNSWSGHEIFNLNVDAGRAGPDLISLWRFSTRVDQAELRVLDAQGQSSLVIVMTWPRIDTVQSKGPPWTMDLTLNARLDVTNNISWFHPPTGEAFSYNPRVAPGS